MSQQVYRSVRGMHDLLPHTRTFLQHEFIAKKALEMAQRYNYRRIETPHVEFSGLFERSLGATSDVIKKEMFLLQNTHFLAESEKLSKRNSARSTAAATATGDRESSENMAASSSTTTMCLRPEGTAGIVRSVIQHNLFHQNLFYFGSMYRYERPQKGRLRQFTQFGVEKIGGMVSKGGAGNAATKSQIMQNSVQQDVEILQMAHSFLRSLGVLDNSHENITTTAAAAAASTLSKRSRVQLELNSLGSSKERAAYSGELIQFLAPLQNELSDESKHRLDRAVNHGETQQVWRILDSKSEQDQRLFVRSGAPMLSDYYSDETKTKFEMLRDLLADLQIDFVVNPYLVRGLDYYSDTTFEFVSDIPVAPSSSGNSSDGTQTTENKQEIETRNVALLAGGRYDGLFRMLGAKNDVEAIGWAAGVERLSLLLDNRPEQELTIDKPVSVCVIGLTGSSESDRAIQRECMRLSQQIRESNITVGGQRSFTVVGPIYGSKLLTGLQRAEKEGCSIAIILGSREVENRVCTIKGLIDRSIKVECSFDRMIGELSGVMNK